MNTNQHKFKPTQLAEGYKWCSRCEQSLAHHQFGNDRRRKGGLALYCRHCQNTRARSFYATRHRTDETTDYIPSGAHHVPVEEFPPPTAEESIGCLRCRHAQLLSEEGNFRPNNPRPSIRCLRQNTQIAVVWQNYPLADPRPMKPKNLRSYWIKYGPLGDKLGHAGEVILAYLKARWAHENAETLTRVTGWPMEKLGKIVHYHGIGGARTANNRLHHMNPRKGRTCFSLEQTHFLMTEYCSERWPLPVYAYLKPAQKSARRRKQNRLVARCNELKPQWNWEQICRHVEKQMRRRADRARRKTHGRRVNQFVVVPETAVLVAASETAS